MYFLPYRLNHIWLVIVGILNRPEKGGVRYFDVVEEVNILCFKSNKFAREPKNQKNIIQG